MNSSGRKLRRPNSDDACWQLAVPADCCGQTARQQRRASHFRVPISASPPQVAAHVFSIASLKVSVPHPSRAASAATCPASEVANVFRSVIDDSSTYSPVVMAVRGDAMTEAVV